MCRSSKPFPQRDPQGKHPELTMWPSRQTFEPSSQCDEQHDHVTRRHAEYDKKPLPESAANIDPAEEPLAAPDKTLKVTL